MIFFKICNLLECENLFLFKMRSTSKGHTEYQQINWHIFQRGWVVIPDCGAIGKLHLMVLDKSEEEFNLSHTVGGNLIFLFDQIFSFTFVFCELLGFIWFISHYVSNFGSFWTWSWRQSGSGSDISHLILLISEKLRFLTWTEGFMVDSLTNDLLGPLHTLCSPVIRTPIFPLSEKGVQ